MTLMFFGLVFTWIPSSGEMKPVTGQEEEISLYLYSWNGSGKLHTMETGGHGNVDEVRIDAGDSLSFALNISLQSDLLVKEYKSNVGFHAYVYANSANWDPGHLKLHVSEGDSATDTSLTLLATGETNVPSWQAGSNNEQRVDIEWIDNDMSEYTFNDDKYIILEFENDGDNDVDLKIDSGKDGGSDSRLITVTNPVTQMKIIRESYDLESSNPDDRVGTTSFMPNLPSNLSKLFVSGEALNAFGTYDIVRFKLTILDQFDDELFTVVSDADDPEDPIGTNSYSDLIWNYNDPAATSSNHNDEGQYTVRVSAITQQGHEFSLDEKIDMEAYGSYVYTSEPEQSVAIGGSVQYDLVVRNSGTQSDSFEIISGDTSDKWSIEPLSQTTGTLGAGLEEIISFTISVSDSTDMVGMSTVVDFKSYSQTSDDDTIFTLRTTTAVGAEYDISLFFESDTGVALTEFDVDGVAGEWNEYELRISNKGQAKDSVELYQSNNLEADWSIKFKSDSATECSAGDSKLMLTDIPRASDGYNVANVTVCVKPAISTSSKPEVEFALTGYSQGDSTVSDTALLIVTRTFGLSLNVVPQSSKGVFIGKSAGETFEIDLELESQLDGEHTVGLSMDNDFPSGWSSSFKENGETVDTVVIDYEESISLVLLITIGSQATYIGEGYFFKALATDFEDKNIIGQQQLNVILEMSDAIFGLSAINYRETLKPGDSHTFQLTIDNNGNSDDVFTITASSVPSGWRVVFPNNNIVSIEAGRQASVPIQVTVGDDAKNGDSETITISAVSGVSNHKEEKSFVVDVEQGFTNRFVSAFTDLWYIFVFLSLITGVGIAGYYRQDDEWDDFEEEDGPSSSNLASDETSDSDEWNDWN